MYIDEDSIRFYDPMYIYELQDQYFDLANQYRQMSPFPQGPQGAPPSAPPNFTPSQPQAQGFGATPFIDSGAIRPCIYTFVYIWPRRGPGFWAWLVFVGPRSVAGFRFTRNNWRYFGMNLRDIRSFQCF